MKNQKLAAAQAQATRRSRASNNARAAEHHASILAIWERKQRATNGPA